LRLLPLPFRNKNPFMQAWPKRASKDCDVVAGWIKNGYPQDIEETKILPLGGLGIATGQESGVVVFDVDGKDGKATLSVLEEKHGSLPDTPTQETPGNGFHFFFRSWGPVKNRSGMLDKEGYPGLDSRADGGQVVAAPSLHPNGKPYKWLEGRDLDDLELAECPEWLKRIIEGEKSDGKPEDTHKERQSSPVDDIIPEGRRDSTLTSLAGTMRKRGMTEAAIEAALLATNRAQCRPPLPGDQVRKIARSIGSKPPGANAEKGQPPKAQGAPKIEVADMFTVVDDDPVPVELIGGLFPRGDVTLMFGKQGCGKTIFVDYLSRQLSEGGVIMDGCLLKSEPARRVIFFEAEVNKKVFGNRKWEYGWGGNTDNLKHVFQSELSKKGVWLDLVTDSKFFTKILEAERPDLVIFDTLQGFHTVDENKADEMKAVFTPLKKWAPEFNCAIVAVHHARKGDTKYKKDRLSIDDAQGSNIILRQSGAVYVVERLNHDDRQMTVFSLKKDWGDGEQDDWFGYEIKRNFYDDGKHLIFDLYPNVDNDKGEAIKNAILSQTDWFAFSDVRKHISPNISDAYIKKILKAMSKGALLETEGAGRGARHRVVRGTTVSRNGQA
jgi:archaellum biogenesis ATPase FlaH